MTRAVEESTPPSEGDWSAIRSVAPSELDFPDTVLSEYFVIGSAIHYRSGINPRLARGKMGSLAFLTGNLLHSIHVFDSPNYPRNHGHPFRAVSIAAAQ